ncbi:MAG: hypothetical protein LQ348_001499 [Seirophora lacunosa]|nr:MAG: hypothetical protein LQ344_007967 [Seirophora lacunosa]KAI4202493.1 MAG: hypothetical protein LQ348_001499 [Seirophora lacunosa]
MKFSILVLTLAAIAGVQAQSSTVVAPCGGTACPSPAPDVTVTRSNPPMTEGTPCPSLIVSSMNGNSSSPSATGAPPAPGAPFTGGANHIAASAGVLMAAVAAALAL